MSHRFTNRLVTETSPYLRQHAHNPVDWYPWGEEALQKALTENKPLLISIGYAACHWCHVMERECFENEEIASFMNRHFVNIKIDREERPDLDHIYMDAVQAISGSGGWPLNVFCTPQARPFFGGTYYPPVRAYNRIAWPELLQNISHAWGNEKDAVNDQAARLTGHISSLSLSCPETPDAFTEAQCREITSGIMQHADKQYGGFGSAPKFPHPSTIRYLFEFGFLFKDGDALLHAEKSLRHLIRGGIYDQIGGGMSRYSTDNNWLVPHFEKMLYDNALLIRLLSDAYQLTGDDEFRRALYHSFSFMMREMKDPKGGFCSALDADSEGVEGKYYVWKKSEIDAVLGADAAWLCEWFGVSEEGNWEETNILHLQTDRETFCNRHALHPDDFEKTLINAISKLLLHRERRVRPGTDNKVISGWNAMLLTAWCRAFAATGDPVFKTEALELYEFLKKHFFKEESVCHIRGKEGKEIPAFADDLAFWVEACIHLQEITGNQDFLREAIRISDLMDNNYLLDSGYFSYSSLRQTDVLFPRPEYYDGAFPSANAVMAQNLHYLSVVLADKKREVRSASMISGILKTLLRQPVSFSSWAIILMYKCIITKEIVIFGRENADMLQSILRKYIPNRVLQTASEEQVEFPLLIGKKLEKHTYIYLCINNSCQEPFADISLFNQKFRLLNN